MTDPSLKKQVWQRAATCCEYCQLPQVVSDLVHQLDHIIAEKHLGPTALDNLALACFWCNVHKGANIAGIDPVSQQLSRLFHPRSDHWEDHFTWNGPELVGLTPVGRTTVQVLEINAPDRILHRQALLLEGVFPPHQDKE